MPHFTNDWFSHHLPIWNKTLQQYKNGENLTFLEIGSYEGMATTWLLENILTHSTSKIHCIDVFNGELRSRFLNNTKPYASKIVLHIGRSFEVLMELHRSKTRFDLIYIDADHTAKSVIEDAVLSFPLTKKKGLMIFDDYDWGMGLHKVYRPKMAIDAFYDLYSDKVDVIYAGQQVILQKR